ncbi:MAG: V-type ATP synthase subunit I, partial [Elusimicrobiota bacterium]
NFKYVQALPVRAGIKELEEIYNIENVYVQKVTGQPPFLAVLFFNKSFKKEVFEKLSHIEYEKVSLPLKNSPSSRIKEIKKITGKIKKKEKDLKNKVEKTFASRKDDYEILGDIYDNRSNLNDEHEKAIHTRYTTAITGWIPRSQKEKLKKLIDNKFGTCYLKFKKPNKDENPPVILKNKKLSAPFEIVTDLYGTPDYNWVDPTPHLSLFFILFFGICLGDAGYGLIMVGATLWAMLKLKLSGGARKFITMLFYSGIASVIIGILAGSWFGNALDGVPLIENLRVINALEKPEYFLYFSVVLGYIQVTYGVIISMVKNLQISDYKEAVYKDMGWVIALLTLPFITMGLTGVISWHSYLLYIAAGAVIWVLIFSGYQNENVFIRFLSGFYEVYDTGIGALKDMISYSRLFALGMGTTILGMAINEISKFTFELAGWASYIIVPVILLAGHLVMNLFMSSLSAYVHTSRLMYVEFFTKFFKGGGTTFNPLRWKNKRVKIEKTQET